MAGPSPRAGHASGDRAFILATFLVDGLPVLWSGTPVMLRVAAEPGEECVRIAVEGRSTPPPVRGVERRIGIEPEMLPRLFEAFSQADRSLDRSRGGLGLALVKGLLELHGGEVHAASEVPGRGARRPGG